MGTWRSQLPLCQSTWSSCSSILRRLETWRALPFGHTASPSCAVWMASRYYSFVYATGRRKTLENTNKLLKRSQIYNGMKTGYTDAAGRCLISSASASGREVILVQLGSKTKYIFDDAERVMRWGLRNCPFVPLTSFRATQAATWSRITSAIIGSVPIALA